MAVAVRPFFCAEMRLRESPKRNIVATQQSGELAMFNRQPFLAGIALAAVAAVASVLPQSPAGIAQVEHGDSYIGKRGKGHNNKRGTGEQAKAKRRTNMVRLSRRVRRRHRRAA